MNFLKRCWQKRWLRRLTWTGMTLVTLYALLCAWMNWSGARQWRATVAMLKAEGETLDFRETLYEPVPDAENFCAIPLLKDVLSYNGGDKDAPGANRKRLDTLVVSGTYFPEFTNAIQGTHANLKEWAGFLRKDDSLRMPPDSGDAARDVLVALSKHDAIVHELAAGLKRPYARWTPEWKTCEFPPVPLMAMRPRTFVMVRSGWHRTLLLRTIAAARTGDAAKAHETALIIARLNESCLDEPLVWTGGIGAVFTGLLHGATWELCAAHTGTAEDFSRLESTLMTLDFEHARLHAFRCEMAGQASSVRGMKIWREDHSIHHLFQYDSERPSRAGDMLIRALPGGMFDVNASVLAELEFRHIIKPLIEHDWRQAMASGKALAKELFLMKQKMWVHPSQIMAAFFIQPAGYIYDFTYAQTLVNQAVIACALERHRIANGSYSDSLDGVRLADGKLLPPDPMDGKPMRYRKTANGRYMLWSIGPDGNDDGGKRIIQNNDPEHTSFNFPDYIGDLVWDFPAE